MIKIGLVGLGKIARDQHLPSIVATPGLELVTVASRNAKLEGVVNYSDLEAMLKGEPTLDAIILCQPPQARYESACAALQAGKHVFLEKPPGAKVTEVESLVALAQLQGVTLFASWHSRYAAAVAQAKVWIAGQKVQSVTIIWKEDVRHWHPGQAWIWAPGGFGVFDPGINALSILTEIIAQPIHLVTAHLETPSNQHTPIAARLSMTTADAIPIAAEFDFRQTGPQSWDIVVDSDAGQLCLSHGGNSLTINGEAIAVAAEREYPAMYQHFADLIRSGKSDVDLAPLKLVADAFLCGQNSATDAFED